MLGGTIWANFASQAPRGVTLATLGCSLGAPGLPGSEELQKQWFVPPGPGPVLGVFFRYFADSWPKTVVLGCLF